MAEEKNTEISMQDLENVVRAMGLVFNNTSLYSSTHSVTRQAMDDCYNIMNNVLLKCADLSFSINEDDLVLNDRPIELKNPLMKMFVTNLSALEISNFVITSGMDRDQFDKLMDVMNSKPDDLRAFGGLPAAISKFEMKNVQATTVTYVKVTADEVVVNKDDLASAVENMDADIEGILKFLKGEGGDRDILLKDIKAIALDAEKLSDLIVKAAEIENDPADDTGLKDSVGKAVSGCLRLTYDALAGEASKTQKGKKELKKILVEVEKELLEKVSKATGTFSEHETHIISDTIEELKDELEIEGLVSEYLKKKQAVEGNENRILRFLRAKGLDRIKDTDLEEKLQQGGLSMDGWVELLAKSGAGDTDDGAGIASVGHLAMLLEQMETNVRETMGGAGSGAGGDYPVALDIMKDVDKEVQKMVIRTEKKIQDLVSQVRAEVNGSDDSDGGRTTQTGEVNLSRKKLLERLAEIVQELCQPLSVINCTVQMILAGCLGGVSDQQSEMLKLADDSGAKLQVLIDHLLKISGVPKGLRPDQEIQSSIFKS